MRNAKKYIHGLIAFSSFVAFGFAFANDKEVSEATIIKFIPSRLKVDSSTGQVQTYKNGIGARVLNADFDSNRGQAYIVIEYNTDTDCELLVLKNDRNEYKTMGQTQLKFPSELKGCSELELKDLDGNGKPELIVNTFDGRALGSPVFLKWENNHLVDISPTVVSNGVMDRDFRLVSVTDKPIQGKLMIFDFDPNDKFAKRRLFEMINGEIKLVGSYDFVSVAGTDGVAVMKPAFVANGDYTLTMKNLSSHDRAVRASVIVNGSEVLKSQDFCSAPQPKKSDKDKWKGNDDDDDRDEDHCKRCISKQDVYAIVNLKTSNEIKVKISGRKDSNVLLTLVKKP